MEKRKCTECGGEFIPARKDSNFCSKLCRQRAWYAKRHKGSKPRPNARNAGTAHSGSGRPDRPQPRPAAPHNGNGDAAVATICVTEERLNHFLMSLPIEAKAEIASQWLGGK